MNIENELQTRVEHFTALKSKYQATKYEDSSPLSLLYLILRKVDLGILTTNLEFDWLKEHELLETVEAIRHDEQRRVEELRKLEQEFFQLKFKYKVPDWQSLKDDISVPLYPILWKLNSENQLSEKEVKWLKKNQLVGTLAIVQEMKLQQHFVALKAIEHHPESYQPYTLMGAIAYDRGDYLKGDYWFEEAIKRGAKTEDIDDEIKRVVRSTKDEKKRHEAVE